MAENLNAEALQNAPETVDDDLMEFDESSADVVDQAISDNDIAGFVEEEVSLNQSAEFLRKFADSFSESFVIDLPNNAIVTQAIKDAKADAKKKLEHQVAKEDRRKKELVAKLAELQKMQ